jgi:hypothetical protein
MAPVKPRYSIKKTSDIFKYAEVSCLLLIGKDRENNYLLVTVKLMKGQFIFYRQFGEKLFLFSPCMYCTSHVRNTPMVSKPA